MKQKLMPFWLLMEEIELDYNGRGQTSRGLTYINRDNRGLKWHQSNCFNAELTVMSWWRYMVELYVLSDGSQRVVGELIVPERYLEDREDSGARGSLKPREA